jgi:RimJ/RimL family protein N-acetyltransferase
MDKSDGQRPKAYLGVEVRELDPEDLLALGDWFGKRWAEARPREPEGPKGSTYLVAWLDGKPVGHCNIRWDGSLEALWQESIRVPEVNGLAASPEGKGIGTALIRAAEATAFNRGYDSIGVGVSIENSRAQELYERLGYSAWEGGVVESIWRQFKPNGSVAMVPETLVYMTKSLS